MDREKQTNHHNAEAEYRKTVKSNRIIFVSSSVGAGHNQAAAALIAGLKSEAPSVRAEFVDALEYVPWWFRCAYAGGYETMVTKFPRLYAI